MSAEDIKCLLQQLSKIDSLPELPIKTKKTHTPAPPPNTPLTPHTNCFQKLVVEKASESASDLPITPEATCGRQPRRPQWERRLPRQPKIGMTELGPRSLLLQVEIESTDTQRKYGVRALVDSGATGLFIDQEYVKSNQIPTKKLSQPIPVYNVDGSTNIDGSISEVVELLLWSRDTRKELYSV